MSGVMEVLRLDAEDAKSWRWDNRHLAQNNDTFVLLTRDSQSEQALAKVSELVEAASVLIVEWDRQDSGRFDVMPAKDWEAAEKRFRAALSAVMEDK